MAKATNNKLKDKKSLFNINPELKHKLEFISWKDTRTQTDIINEILQDYIGKWERKNGEIPSK